MFNRENDMILLCQFCINYIKKSKEMLLKMNSFLNGFSKRNTFSNCHASPSVTQPASSLLTI